jgi:hypothetical protein
VMGGRVNAVGQTGNNGDAPMRKSTGDRAGHLPTARRRVRGPTTDTPTSPLRSPPATDSTGAVGAICLSDSGYRPSSTVSNTQSAARHRANWLRASANTASASPGPSKVSGWRAFQTARADPRRSTSAPTADQAAYRRRASAQLCSPSKATSATRSSSSSEWCMRGTVEPATDAGVGERGFPMASSRKGVDG